MKKIVIAGVAALALSTSAMAGAVVKTKCAGCHGADFGKSALGKSKIVKDLTHDEIATALKGYKAGTFGGPMKGLMRGQVASYSDAELEAFAKTIGK